MGNPRTISVPKTPGAEPEIIIIRSLADACALFDLDKYLVPYLQEEPFFCEVSRYIAKRPSLAVPTAGICYNPKEEEFQMLWNPLFFCTLPEVQIFGVIKHEFMHFVCRHLTERRRDPADAHNIASDGAINSLIMKDDGNTRHSKNGELPLPGFAIIPGRKPDPIPDAIKKRMTKEQIKWNEMLADLVAGWPELETTEHYFGSMMDFLQQNPKPKGRECPVHGPSGRKRRGENGNQGAQGKGEGEGDKEEKSEGGGGCGHEHGEDGEPCDCGGDGMPDDECTCDGYGSLDDHSGWDDIPEEVAEYVRSKAQNIVEKAVREADQRSNGWGSVPAHMRELIRKSVSNIVNWREILKHFVGQIVRGRRSTSIKRINRKYPYVHPGVKRGYTAKLLVTIDESGSVPNGCVELFFAELASLTKTVEVDIVSFDCECDPKEIVTWHKGQTMPVYRARCGGTDFNAPTRVANDPRFRGRWDGFCILTDGYAPKPESSRIQRAWGIAPGCSPEFQTDELLFRIEPGAAVKKGSWY